MARLRPGQAEPYVLEDEGGLAGVVAAVLGAPDAWPEVRRALQLCVALETRLGSATAASRIKAVLSEEPRALGLIERQLITARSVDELRGFLEQQGRDAELRAPSLNDPPPPDTVKLEALRPRTRGWIR